jgi:glycosyltransferase involved in cell wall biosynthesis
METGLKSRIARYFLHKFRIWDTRTANGVDVFIANSHFIKKRIFKCYRREAEVIFPPVDVSQFALKKDKQDFYLTASRMVPYKRIDLIVSAFTQMPDRKLKVIGDGPEMEKIREIAKGHNNIEILGFQLNEVLVDHLQNAKAFVFAAEEDFGILPVEAQACGTPVLAFGKGGCLETVKDGVTGLHFEEQTESSIINAVNRFESNSVQIEAEVVRKNAELFSSEHFQQSLNTLVAKELGN